MHAAFVTSALLLLAGCAAAPKDTDPRPLGIAQMRSDVFGNTMAGEGPPGYRWTIYVAPDGAARIVGTAPDGRPFEGRGRYWVEGERLCRQWPGLGDGKPFCAGRVVREGDRRVSYHDDGRVESRFTVRPGNPMGL